MKNLDDLTIFGVTTNNVRTFDQINIRNLCRRLTSLQVEQWPCGTNNNPPLKEINFEKVEHFTTDFGMFFHYCPTLKYVGYCTPGQIWLMPCQNWKKLKSLTINLRLENGINELFVNLTTLVHSRKLKLYDCSVSFFDEHGAPQVAFLQLAEALPNLKIIFVSSLDLSFDTIVKFI